MNTEPNRHTDKIAGDSDESTLRRLDFENRHDEHCLCTSCGYARYLSELRPWQFFFTGTFASPVERSSDVFERCSRHERTGRVVHDEGAIKALHNHLRHAMCLTAHEVHGIGHRVKTKAGHYRWKGAAAKAWDKGHRPDYVLSLEKNKHNTGVHIHALVAPHPDWEISWSAMKTWWDKQGFGDTQEIRPGDTVRWGDRRVPVATKVARYMVKYSLKDTSTENTIGRRTRYEKPNSQGQFRHRNPSELHLAPWLSPSAPEATKEPVLVSEANVSDRRERSLLVAV